MTVLLVGLASGVAALALSRGSIAEPLRARLTGLPGELIRCPLCLSFWLCGALWLTQGHIDVVEWGASWAISTGYAAVVERLAE